jgi:hydrogenase expression/formation protein HypE
MKKNLILLAHGEGGELTRGLIDSLFVKSFENRYLARLEDAARMPDSPMRIVFTTDSYVVNPLFFPGGDIGTLSVYGTCNDLAVMGAKPGFLSCAFILEEGLPLDILESVVRSMARAGRVCGVRIVTGDTKVVERGNADGMYITTSGIGYLDERIDVSSSRVKPGDAVLISGFIGDHGIAVLTAREHLDLRSPVESDAAPLWLLTRKLVGFGRSIRFMRDPTRGGVATTLCELARTSGVSVEIREERIPVRDEVKGICDILGFDPLYLANEGKLLLVVSKRSAAEILRVMRAHPLGRNANIIGEVKEQPAGRVIMRTSAGGRRIVSMLSGEQLPRIC